MPFLDKTGLAHLWNHIVARLNGKAEKSDLDNLEASLTEQITNIDLSAYETKTNASSKLTEAKTYTDTKTSGLASTSTVDTKISTHNTSTSAHNDIREVLAAVKEDVDTFFNNADLTASAKDTLKEIQDYITSDATAAAEMTASLNNKSEKGHKHEIVDVNGLQTALDDKAASTHTHSNASLGQGYGDCYTTGSATEKVVDIYGYNLENGGVVSVKFIYSVPASAKININGKGAKEIYYKGSAITNDIIKSNDTATFVYDGLRYHLISIDRWHNDIVDLQANDGKVNQRVASANSNYPLLLAKNFQEEDCIGQVYFDSGVYLNPYYNKIYADISGTASGLSSTLDITHGGTGATDVSTARINLGLDGSITLGSVEITLPYGNNWSDVVYGNGKFVAVAENSSVAIYSTNGITWTETTMPTSAQWKSVVYGDGKFIAIAYGTDIAAYSADGINWTETKMPSSTNWQTAAFGNGTFIAIAFSSFRAAYSTDGINWIGTDMPSSATWYCASFGNNTFVAVANSNGIAAYSADGITWVNTIMPSSASWLDVTFGNGKFVAIASSNIMAAYSTDGITWESGYMPASTTWSRVAFGNGVFVAIANNSTSTAYSTDGINWIDAEMVLTRNWRCFTYGCGKFMAIPYGDTDATISTDGITWSTSAQVLRDVNDADITQTVKSALGISGASTSGADVDNAILITVEDIDTICGASIQYANLSEGAF